MRARASQARQNRVVAAKRSLASSTSFGAARPPAHDSAQYTWSPARRTWRARTRSPSMPRAMSVCSRMV